MKTRKSIRTLFLTLVLVTVLSAVNVASSFAADAKGNGAAPPSDAALPMELLSD